MQKGKGSVKVKTKELLGRGNMMRDGPEVRESIVHSRNQGIPMTKVL